MKIPSTLTIKLLGIVEARATGPLSVVLTVALSLVVVGAWVVFLAP